MKESLRNILSPEWRNAITHDPDDNKFFDVAVAANADYLVTKDAHFNEADRLPSWRGGVTIVLIFDTRSFFGLHVDFFYYLFFFYPGY